MNLMKTELLQIMPLRYRPHLSESDLRTIQEIRLRPGNKLSLVTRTGHQSMDLTVTEEDLRFCVNTASRYSPWNATTVKDGYLTAPGGHRIGICGEVAGDSYRTLTSLCIRISKDLHGIADHLRFRDSTLILGPPGSGKTTLLRELIRRISMLEQSAISVVDERCEIFPLSNGKICFDPGPCTDILSGKDKSSGIESVLRSMGPKWIAVDEITAQADTEALLRAGWCGVKLLATAHGSSIEDLCSRSVYQPLTQLFRSVIIMHPDQSCHMERI